MDLQWIITNLGSYGIEMCLCIAVAWLAKDNQKIKDSFNKELLNSVNKIQGKTVDLIASVSEQIKRTNDIHEKVSAASEQFRRELKGDMTELRREISDIKEIKSHIKDLDNRISLLGQSYNNNNLSYNSRSSYDRDYTKERSSREQYRDIPGADL